MASIVGSIRSLLVPIRREGWPFIAVLLFLAAFLGWFWLPLAAIFLILAGWCTYFFRDPDRVTPTDPALAVSPADGRVAAVTLVVAPPELGLGEQTRRRISIFMSVFNCHVNRAPVAGRVARIVYAPGEFFNAELDKASEANERNSLVIETPTGPVAVVQIAGLVARRIVCFTREGADLLMGERFGLIRFGSRLDVYLPMSAEVLVRVGQTAIAGETPLARFAAPAAEPAPRAV